MKKAWDTHDVCDRCKKTRTKNELCAKCVVEVRKGRRAQKRTGWDQYFMAIAKQVSTRATCKRKEVGAVLVRDRTILSTGYNGSVRGMAHCADVGCMMEEGHCVRTVHAEANAIIQAAKNGVSIDGATIYTTASPCWWCFKLIVNAGVTKIVFGELYRDQRIHKFAVEAEVGLQYLNQKESETEVLYSDPRPTPSVRGSGAKAIPRRGRV